MKNIRFIYACLALLMVVLGLATRIYSGYMPGWVIEYAGDVLWAAMVYLGIRFVAPASGYTKAAIAALLFSYLIEISQLYQAPWIRDLRANSLAALVLGQGFLWSDLICYTLGVLVTYAIDKWGQIFVSGIRWE
ncbi:MAG: DUF2809 domain-containing protein [Tannerellaceae bacterium]|nr:DUF2809 domain-containing protein [Tannerellaceae bacterium]